MTVQNEQIYTIQTNKKLLHGNALSYQDIRPNKHLATLKACLSNCTFAKAYEI